MNPKPWQQIESLYQSIKDLEPSERDAWLAEACAGDEEFQREVESLWRQDSIDSRVGSGFLQQIAAQAKSGTGQSMIGAEIGSFKILSLLGVGGWAKFIVQKI